jgi:hypothetical protein
MAILDALGFLRTGFLFLNGRLQRCAMSHPRTIGMADIGKESPIRKPADVLAGTFGCVFGMTVVWIGSRRVIR